MNILKKLGRYFLILTEEEKYINPGDIKAVLIVSLGEGHFEKAYETARKRFPFAMMKIISSSKVIDIMARLRNLKEERFSMAIVLSLNPFVIVSLSLNFNCYLLIYNKFNQWFLIRRKTVYEFLAGRRGADKEGMDWRISPVRLNLAKCLTAMLVLPFIFIRNMIRLIKLIGYILLNLSQLFIKRFYYKILYSARRL